MPGLCRDCLADLGDRPDRRCPACGSPRLVAHPDLDRLAIAHLDCDAFYAAVEKRDRPDLADRPVAVGGAGGRGVVMTACYVARTYGVRSAMPMFKALKACPDLVVIRPDMEKYRAVSRQIRALMAALTPLVEPLSIDEAFLDMSGTEALHGTSPARTLARLQRQIEREFRLTVSLGLSHNKFLAKLASDSRKPRGFALIGQAETQAWLDPLPVTALPGVGQALAARLSRDGLSQVVQLRAADPDRLAAHYGKMGQRLAALARGQDDRPVLPGRLRKSLSSETTFDRDEEDRDWLEAILWRQCERVAADLKQQQLAVHGVVLKLKTDRFRLITRSARLANPTQLAAVLFAAARPLLAGECGPGKRYRLLGLGTHDFVDPALADLDDLADQSRARTARTEAAIDALRQKFGRRAIAKGRSLQDEKGGS